MFPHSSSKVFQTVASIVAVIFVVKNPERAAELVTQVIDAVSTFAGAL